MDNQDILQRIQALVQEEHELREQPGDSVDTPEQDSSTRLKRVEEELDQCWDLLRQRRARSEFGQDTGETGTRSESTVEGYLQ